MHLLGLSLLINKSFYGEGSMPEYSGQSIGRYYIVEKLGEGGMAIVYKAYDTRLECDVAVKFIRTENLAEKNVEKTLKRFKTEAQKMAQLTHPFILPVTDFGDYEGMPYLVMRYIPGGTLKQKLGKPMSYQDAARILIPIANALEYAHRQNIIHRDVKPANILITQSGEPMLSDFGIAKILVNVEETHDSLTGTGVGIGTPEYMSPEQALGQSIDGRTDIYSLGVVFYELITGQKPFCADTPMAVVVKQIHDPLPRPKDFVKELPESVEHIIFKALAKKPEDRYQSMGELAAALEKLAFQGTTPTPANVFEIPVIQHSEPPVWVTDRNIGVERISKPLIPNSFPQRHRFPGRLWVALAGMGLLGLIAAISLTLDAKTSAGLAVLSPTKTMSVTPSQTIARAQAATNPIEISAAPPAPAASKVISLITPTLTLTASKIMVTPTERLGIGSTYISEKDGMMMMYVPVGEFQMGATVADHQSCNTRSLVNEYDPWICNHETKPQTPQHSLWLDAYWIDQTEVTNRMYASCVTDGVCLVPHKKSSITISNYYGNHQFDNYPVINVDWNMAKTYCEWTGKMLTTEAQWEKAAKGTDDRIYPWGNQSSDSTLSNYDPNKGDMTQVGSYPKGASPYGVFDMAGKVWEWVADWYGSDYYASSPTKDPAGPSSGMDKIQRGGFWIEYWSNTFLARIIDRGASNPATWSSYGSFRCVMSTTSSN
jgi:eukaryotic-like serine/threonine-protein kinase